VTTVATTSSAPDRSEKTLRDYRELIGTILTVEGPSPEAWAHEPAPPTWRFETYDSDGRSNLVMVHEPAERSHDVPALVYLHGGFSMSPSFAAEVLTDYVDAGFTVVVPTYRGENGNTGNFELLFGEVNDAAAAIEWTAALDSVDPDSVFVIGHSVGGGIADLLALEPNLPIALSASIGALYDESFVIEYGPFDSTRDQEVVPRLAVNYLPRLPRRHIAYFGTDDSYQATVDWIAQFPILMQPRPGLLDIVEVPGDHFDSLAPALDRFRAEIESSL